MDWYCESCDITNEISCKNNHLRSLKHANFSRCLRTKHTKQCPNFFDIDEKIHENFKKHKKNFLKQI